MQVLPRALAGLGKYRQFIICHLSPDQKRPGKTLKHPIDPRTMRIPEKGSGGALSPEMWLDFEQAQARVTAAGWYGAGTPGYAVGFVLTNHDPFFLLDIDDCMAPDGHVNHVAQSLLQMLPGAGVEESQSGRGLHIIGSGICPEHGCKNIRLGLELYTQDRFVVLTGANTNGSVLQDCSEHLPGVVQAFFPVGMGFDDGEWNEEPVPDWHGPEDDDLLIEKAKESASASAVFGTKASFRDLFEANEDVLCQVMPSATGDSYDRSSADASLAQHLAFWTGNNHERIHRLMWKSELVREKWRDRSDYYLPKTIRKAVSRQSQVYNALRQVTGVQHPAPAPAIGPQPENAQPQPAASHDEDSAEIVATAGYQFMTAEQQLRHFHGCVYVRDAHRVFVPDGAFLKPDQFKASYGGYVFALDNQNSKTSKNAWEVFTESQAMKFPKVHSHAFRPALPPGSIFQEEGRLMVNTYVPVETPRVAGDPSPFLDHLARLIPDEHDRMVLLSYMAAVVQYPGVKFQYAPVVQGIPGNGKTTLARALEFAVSRRYSHMPSAKQLGEGGAKFTAWLDRKLFIGVEDIHVPNLEGGLLDVLKPMITNDRLELQKKGFDQEMMDNYANWLLFCNRKSDVPKGEDDRRYAIIFTAQQVMADLELAGMVGTYFSDLYAWLRREGYAIVNDYLREFKIPDQFNPALLSRAPVTSSTAEAIDLSRSEVEQRIIEAIEAEIPGFRGGWISSIMLDQYLEKHKLGRALPHAKRRDLLKKLGYDWHPYLHHSKGRVHNVLPAEGAKPKLFLKIGHVAGNIASGAEITAAYEKAQGYLSTDPSKVFSSTA